MSDDGATFTPHRGPAIAGWILTVLLTLGWSAAAWLDLGLGIHARLACSAMTTLLVLIQVVLTRFSAGGILRGVASTLITVVAVVAADQVLPAHLVHGTDRPAQHDAPAPSSSASAGPGASSPDPATATPSSDPTAAVRDRPDERPDDGDRWARLPNRDRVDCKKEIFPARPIVEIRRSYSAKNWRGQLLELLETRYPDAAKLVGELADPSLFDVWFHRGKDDWNDAMTELSTAVHESSHLVDLSRRRGNDHVLIVEGGKELRFTIPTTFARSKILPELPAQLASLSYNDTYLTGASGAQGFEMVLEEQNAYIYSVLVSVAIADQLPANMSVSARDGLMVFIYYVEAYLRIARTEQDATYKAILKNRALLEATIHLSDRAACALSLTSGHDNLGIADKKLWPFVFGKDALGEVERLRDSPAPH